MSENTIVVIKTSEGTFKAELWADKAPISVRNFLSYIDDKHYDGLIFHRVIDGFMVQGGGFDVNMAQKTTKAQIKNEASADVPNDRGTLAMARTMVVDSASCQFFVNLVDNDFLNHRDETDQGFGYCVFGKVIDGMDIVDKIGKVETVNTGFAQNVPAKPIVIESITRVE